MMTRHLSKTWLYCFSRLGQQRLVAQDRRVRRKAVSAGLRFCRLKSAPWGCQLVDKTGRVVRHSVHDRDIEGYLDYERGQRKAATA